MAQRRAGIGEMRAGFRYETPGVAPRSQCQDEHAERVVVADAARRETPVEGRKVVPSCPDDELADAPPLVDAAEIVLWSEAFVVVKVAAQDDLDPERLEVVPERPKRLVAMRRLGGGEVR